MKKYIALIIMLLLSYIANAQYKTTFSGFTDFNFSKGVEIRGEFENWYLGFQAENLYIDREQSLNWGFSLGCYEDLNRFTWFYGVRVGFVVLDSSKPSFGVETELDYNINDNVYIGVRGAYDLYLDSPNVQTPQSYELIRPFIKIGYKF